MPSIPKRAFPLGLVDIAVNCLASIAALNQLVVNLVHVALGSAKDHAIKTHLMVNNAAQRFEFIPIFNLKVQLLGEGG